MQSAFSPSQTRWRRQAGFTFVEVAGAVLLVAVFFAGAFFSTSRGLTMLRTSKETLAASKILQERIETLRAASWTEVTDAETVKSFYGKAPEMRGLGKMGSSGNRVAFLNGMEWR